MYIEDQSSAGNGDEFSPMTSEMLKTAEEMEKDGAEQMEKVIEEATAQSKTAITSRKKSIAIIIVSIVVVAVIIAIVFLLRRKSGAQNLI